MATYPQVNIGKIIRQSPIEIDTVTIPKVFIVGFSNRGPSNEAVRIFSINQFEQIFGKPTIDTEYASYEAVKNALLGGAFVDFFKLPYVGHLKYGLNNEVAYYFNLMPQNVTGLTTNIFTDFDKIQVINDSLSYQLSNLPNNAYYFSQQQSEHSTHKLIFKSKFNNRTLFDLTKNEENNELNYSIKIIQNKEYTSLGIVPVFIGSLNEVLIDTNHINLKNIIYKYFLQHPIILKSAIFEKANKFNDVLTDEIFLGYTKKPFSDTYLTILSEIKLNNLNKTNNKHSAVVVIEILIDSEYNIYVEVLETIIGCLGDNILLFENNIVNQINKSSKYITAEILSLDSNTKLNYLDIDEKNNWVFTEFSSFKLLGDCFSTNTLTIGDDLYYTFTSDNIFKTGLNKYIDSLFGKNYVNNRVYDYIVASGINDSYETLDSTNTHYFVNEELSYRLYIIDDEPVMQYNITEAEKGVVVFTQPDNTELAFTAEVIDGKLFMQSVTETDVLETLKVQPIDEYFVIGYEKESSLTESKKTIYRIYAENNDVHIIKVDDLTPETYNQHNPSEYMPFSFTTKSNKLFVENGSIKIEIDQQTENSAVLLFNDVITNKAYIFYTYMDNQSLDISYKLNLYEKSIHINDKILNSLLLTDIAQPNNLYNIFVENGELKHTLINTVLDTGDRQYFIPYKLNTVNKFIPFNDHKEIISVLNKFVQLYKDCTIFYDIPLHINNKLNNLVDEYRVQQDKDLFNLDITEIINGLNLFNDTTKKYINSLFKNIMFLNNHQYIDRFDNIKQDYVIVPPSSETILSYAFADFYRWVAPLAYGNIKEYYQNCHNSIIKTNEITDIIFQVLFDRFLINSLNNDINNNTFINQQMLCSKTNSIFTQHHAFRIAKYLKQHLIHLGNQIMYEPNTELIRKKFKTNIEFLLQQYYNSGAIEKYLVICDDTNNTNKTIENNELWCVIYVTIFGAIVKINMNIIQGIGTIIS